MTLKVSFLGLGAIGRPMAAHLAAGPFGLTVWNRTAARAAAFATEFRVTHAATPAEAASAADVVITCFPVSADVESVLGGVNGLFAGMPGGSVLVDCTSGDPATSQRIAARLAERGVGFLDTPVSGGTAGAESGTLTVMVGGDPALLERVRPALASFGKKIVHGGAIGAGHALKAMNNVLLAQHIASLTEALLTLQRAGVAPAVALEVINASSGRSNTSENLFPARVLTRAFPRTFRLALLAKDAGIAADLAAQQGVESPNLDLTVRLFREALAALGTEADHVEFVRWKESQVGTELR